MINLKTGDIIIVNNWNGSFLSKLIRFFTNSWSHTAIGFFDLPRNPLPVQTIFEANLTTGITDWAKLFDDIDYDLRVYRWTQPVEIERICWELYDSYNGNIYGWWQLLYFVWRWIVEKLHLPQRFARKNFFPNQEICTELIYVALAKLQNDKVNAVLAKINRDQNTVHPGDIMEICEMLVKEGLLTRTYVRER